MRVIDSFPLLYHELGHLWHFQRRMDGGESVQDFFGDWCAFEGRSDVGYYLGAELVYALAENRSPQQLADLNPDEVYGMLAAL